MCFHLKSIKRNLAKWFGSAKSYNSLIQILLYWDFIIQSESLCSKKWTSRSLRFCKSETNLGYLNSEPLTTVVLTHLFLQGSGELKTLWLRWALWCEGENSSPELCWQKCTPYTWQVRCVFGWEVLSLASSTSFLSCVLIFIIPTSCFIPLPPPIGFLFLLTFLQQKHNLIMFIS